MAENEKEPLATLRIDRDRFENTRKVRGKRKKILLGLAGLLVLILIVLGMGGALNPPPKVQTAPVTVLYPAQLHRVLVASGYVVAQRKAAVASKGTGRLVELNVVEGDYVARNVVLARIESGEIEAAVAQARSLLESARAALSQAEAEASDAETAFARVRTLYANGSVSKADFDIAEARDKRARASVKAASSNIKAAEAAVRATVVQLENTVIRAPFDGTVLTKNADVGEVVAPFGAAANARGAVVTMADMRSLEVEADVSESNIEKVSIGQPCEIILDAYPNTRYRGEVSKIVPTADRAKATVMTKIRFRNLDKRVLPEMSAKVSYLPMEGGGDLLTQKPKLVVNASAVVRDGGAVTVFVVNDGILAKRAVSIGTEAVSMVEVLSGLKAGDVVVLRPDPSFEDGMRVEIDAQ